MTADHGTGWSVRDFDALRDGTRRLLWSRPEMGETLIWVLDRRHVARERDPEHRVGPEAGLVLHLLCAARGRYRAAGLVQPRREHRDRVATHRRRRLQRGHEEKLHLNLGLGDRYGVAGELLARARRYRAAALGARKQQWSCGKRRGLAPRSARGSSSREGDSPCRRVRALGRTR